MDRSILVISKSPIQHLQKKILNFGVALAQNWKKCCSLWTGYFFRTAFAISESQIKFQVSFPGRILGTHCINTAEIAIIYSFNSTIYISSYNLDGIKLSSYSFNIECDSIIYLENSFVILSNFSYALYPTQYQSQLNSMRIVTQLYDKATHYIHCLLYTSDAADDTPCVDLGGRRIIKKKKIYYKVIRTGQTLLTINLQTSVWMV
eukprot:TRINITY_DN9300_c0_g1_i2.p1 TRINITY_DN9300_c0_g1~~TRINITY_DN9300_c0_g1_i2.p1  ORF type:complete len:205 (+),score=16.22 TRINITY_DN9300_c0_g1_i2:194-808(+)